MKMQRNISLKKSKEEFASLIQLDENKRLKEIGQLDLKNIIMYSLVGEEEFEMFKSLELKASIHDSSISNSSSYIGLYKTSYSYEASWEKVHSDIKEIMFSIKSLMFELTLQKIKLEEIEQERMEKNEMLLNIQIIRSQLDKISTLFFKNNESKLLSHAALHKSSGVTESESLDEYEIEDKANIKSSKLALDIEYNTIKDAQDRIALEVLESYDRVTSELKEQIKESKLKTKAIEEESQSKLKELDEKLQLRIKSLEQKELTEAKLLEGALHQVEELQHNKKLLIDQCADLSSKLQLQKDGKPIVQTIECKDLLALLDCYSTKTLFYKATTSSTLANLRKLSTKGKGTLSLKEIEECIKGKNEEKLIEIFHNPSQFNGVPIMSSIGEAGIIVREIANMFRNPRFLLMSSPKLRECQ